MKKMLWVLIFIILGFKFITSNVNATGLIDVISLGISAKPVDIIVNEITNKIYVAEQTNQKIYVIDGNTNSVITEILLNGKPEALSFNKNTNRIYVIWVDNKTGVGNVNIFVSIIDGDNFNTISTFSKAGGSGFIFDISGTDINEVDNILYINGKYFNPYVNETRGLFTAFNSNTNTFYDWNLYITSFNDGKYNNFNSRFYQITGRQIETGWTSNLEWNPSFRNFTCFNSQMQRDYELKKLVLNLNNDLYVSSPDGYLIKWNNSISSTCSTIFLGGTPFAINTNKSFNIIYISNIATNQIQVVDGINDTLIGSVSVGLNPIALTVNSITNRIYVANFSDGTISVIEGFLPSFSQMINPTDGGTLKCNFGCKPNHQGVDIDKSLYQKLVKSTADGIVVKIDNIDDSNAGKWVWIYHGDITKLNGIIANKIATRYLHLDSIGSSISVGQHISQGTIIGTVGGTGGRINYVPHLHFEVRQGDIPFDLDYTKTIALDPLGFVFYPSSIFSVTALSPVDISIIDPDGMVINKTRNDFGTFADYFEPRYKGIPDDGEDIDGYDMITFDQKKDGDYLVKVISEQRALPEDTFSLKANICGVSTTLSENTLVSNISDAPYVLRLTECSFEKFIPIKIIVPALNTEYILGSQIQIQFSAVDNIFGTVSISAKLNGEEVLNGQNVILTKPGNNTFEIIAIDNNGYATILTKTFNIIYNFGSFLPPIKIDGSGVYSLGRTLPVKFQLTDINGNFVSNSISYLYVAKIAEGIIGNDEIALSVSVADTGNQFRYDLNNNQYIYNLSTDILSVGFWQLKAVLDSGQIFVVDISIK